MDAFPDYERYDATGLAELVKRGEVHPRELVEAAIARVEARNPRLNAVVHRMDARALAAAKGPLPAGPFAGVPFLLKDLLAAYAGEPLTSSCRFLADFVPDHDSELVRRLQAAGLVVFGKTNTPELGIMGVTEPAMRGPARNPWSTDHTPGGSSGGSAAAVAAGMVPAAHGGDGGGSIRIPASCCGLFGLKPSRGRNPLDAEVGDGWCGLVQEHAITRSVRDSAALLDATCGPAPGSSCFAPEPRRPFLQEVGADPGRLRIAYTAESLFGESTHPDCKAAVEDAARLCESLGHHVAAARPDFDKAALRRAYLTIVAVGTARAVDLAVEAVGREPKASRFEAETWMLSLIGRRLGANLYQAAIDALHQAAYRLAAFFASYDLLLTPTLAHPPSRIGAFALSARDRATLAVLRAFPARKALAAALEKMAAEAFEATANTMLFNQTGQPAMSVPLFWNQAVLPIGCQFAARYGEEGTLLRLAAQLEQTRPWAERRPPEFSDSGGAGEGR